MKNWKKMLLVGLAMLSVTATAAFAGNKIELNVAGGDEDSMTLDTGAVKSMLGISACRHLYEGLYKLGPDGEIVLGQAESVDVSEDGMTWTFKIRDDAVWSDGKPVTTADFVCGWTHLAEQDGPFKTLQDSTSVSLDVVDDKNMVMRLAYPCKFLPEVLAFVPTYPIREDYLDMYGSSYATDPEKAVYNGPYEMTEWKHGEKVVMQRREDYYDSANISVKAINWNLTNNEYDALEAFERGELDFSDLCPEDEMARMQDAGLCYTPGSNNYCVMFNNGENGNDVLKDARVRKALSLAIDRKHLVEISGLNDMVLSTFMCTGFTDENGRDYTEYAPSWFDPDDYEANCEEARDLLAQAGYPDGAGFPELIYITNTNGRKEVAEAIAYDWEKQLGIGSVDVYKVENFFEARAAGDYDLAYFGWVMDYMDLSNMYCSLEAMAANDAFWENDDYKEEFYAGVRSLTQEEQWEHYAECERILAEEVPAAPLFQKMDYYLFDDTVYDGLVFNCGCYVFTYITEKT